MTHKSRKNKEISTFEMLDVHFGELKTFSKA
jgi:hypothetical protein